MNTHKPHVIVVEDEPKIAKLLADYLERDGYRVSTLDDGTTAVETIAAAEPAFVILDLMLPGKDGLTICREVRQHSKVPIMMLTAKIDEIDRLLGLELGADDYVCKPFSPREVMARVKTILRRVQHTSAATADENGRVRYREISIFPDRFECFIENQTLELTPVEFRLLQQLVEKPGRVFSRDQLMTIAYTDNRVVSDRTIDTHMKNLRKKLADATPDEKRIHSIYGVGYKLD
ncbi:MAG: response regulator [Pseudomonadota bacterium]